MRKCLLLFVTILLLGCGVWKDNATRTLNVAHAICTTARVATESCENAIAMCLRDRESDLHAPCTALIQCQAIRRKVVNGCIEVERIVLAGYLAIEAGDRVLTAAQAKKATDLAAKVQP